MVWYSAASHGPKSSMSMPSTAAGTAECVRPVAAAIECRLDQFGVRAVGIGRFVAQGQE
jgi:hypothetical protein